MRLCTQYPRVWLFCDNPTPIESSCPGLSNGQSTVTVGFKHQAGSAVHSGLIIGDNGLVCLFCFAMSHLWERVFSWEDLASCRHSIPHQSKISFMKQHLVKFDGYGNSVLIWDIRWLLWYVAEVLTALP